MEEVLLKAGSFILIIICGYLLKKIGLFKKEENQTIMKIVINITLPAAVIASFENYERDMSLIFIAIIGIILNLIMISVGYLAAWKKDNKEKAFNTINYAGYNIGTFVLPYLQNFLGSSGIVVACIFDSGSAIMSTGITYGIASSIIGDSQNKSIVSLLKKMFSSVPFIVYSTMLLFYILHIRLPASIYTIASAFGSGNAFLAMFMIGGAFEFCLEKNKLKQIFLNLLLRYGFASLFAYLFYYYLPYSLEVRQIMAIIAFAPVSGMGIIYTHKLGCDVERAGNVNSMTILTSLIIITLLVSYWQLGV